MAKTKTTKTRNTKTTSKSKPKARSSGGASNKLAEEKRKQDLLNDRIAALQQTLRFKQFLAASFEPTISDSEIIVCFADVRGFTSYCHEMQQEMQDRKIQNFLRRYITIFNEGLTAWCVQHVDENYSKPEEHLLKIAEYMMPSMYKNLGDGLMMVWEIPAGLDISVQGNLSQNVVFAIDEMRKRFYYHFRELFPKELDAYSKRVLELELGVGIAKGHAWRLDYGHAIDYAGSIINLASRLEGFARPSGMVAHYDVSSWLFNTLVSEGQAGQIIDIEDIKGYGAVRAWISPDVDSKQKGFKPVNSANKAPQAKKQGRVSPHLAPEGTR